MIFASSRSSDPFTRALICRLLTLGPEGQIILANYLATAVAPARDLFRRAIVEAQCIGLVDRSLDPAVVEDAVAGALVYKLLTGEAEVCSFEPAEYIRSLFRIVGLQ